MLVWHSAGPHMNRSLLLKDQSVRDHEKSAEIDKCYHPKNALNRTCKLLWPHQLLLLCRNDLMFTQLLEERDAELERTEASLEGHKKAGDAREAVRAASSMLH